MISWIGICWCLGTVGVIFVNTIRTPHDSKTEDEALDIVSNATIWPFWPVRLAWRKYKTKKEKTTSV